MDAEKLIGDFVDPYLGETWAALGAVNSVAGTGSGLAVEVELGYPAASMQAEFQEALTELTGQTVALTLRYASPALSQTPPLRGVRNIVAVASGKGGVGKSTTAVNLALALSAEGARVGILDADIYGPSIGVMLGVPEGRRPEIEDEKFLVPIKAHGIQAMSMSFLVTDQTPMVWRGPMASGALQQLLGQSLWADLDMLIVDMPPGTGDIQLTLAQKASVAGAVIVTTPQDIALQDARKGVEMFRKVDIPVLGVIENMSVHHCPECGHESHIFGEGGGQRIADQYDTVLLGALPLAVEVREQVDSGQPSVVAEPDGAIALAYRSAARHMAARLWKQARSAVTAPSISISDD
jgi:ATP-binding protein involved in chromosome partitioning